MSELANISPLKEQHNKSTSHTGDPSGMFGAKPMFFQGGLAKAGGIIFILSWLVLFGPAYLSFFQGAWALEQNMHMPFVLAICIGLAYAQFSTGDWAITNLWFERLVGLLILFFSCLAFFYSRIQEVDLVLSATQIVVGLGAVIGLFGYNGVRKLWFVFLLSFYLILWPGWAIDMITFPLKIMISQTVSQFLFMLGLPVTHEGAIINAGAYELLVADACSGVNSLIALTCVGVVYLYVIKRPCLQSNIITALALVPIAIIANMIRVGILVLITYFLGYDAGQSFLHDLSGIATFAFALMGVFVIEALAAQFFMRNWAKETVGAELEQA